MDNEGVPFGDVFSFFVGATPCGRPLGTCKIVLPNGSHICDPYKA